MKMIFTLFNQLNNTLHKNDERFSIDAEGHFCIAHFHKAGQ